MGAMKRSLLGASLLFALTFGLVACDSAKDAPDKREDEGGDKVEAPAAEESKAKDAEDEEDEARLSDGKKTTPTPATPKTDTPSTKTGDFKTADQFGKVGAGTAKTGDEVKKIDDGGDTSGDTPIGATPFKSDKRGAGSNTGGQCPCMRGLVCCDGVCKKSCS